MKPDPNYRQTAAAAIAGDQAALVRLLEVAQPDIRRFARSQCRSANDVEDAVQETLLQLYRRSGTIRLVEALSGWLFTTVRRACRRMALVAFHGGEALDDNLLDERLSRLSTTDLRMDVAAAIASLPQHYREIILLRDVEELSVGEIGASLGLTRETVKARLHRARGLLREYLRD